MHHRPFLRPHRRDLCGEIVENGRKESFRQPLHPYTIMLLAAFSHTSAFGRSGEGRPAFKARRDRGYLPLRFEMRASTGALPEPGGACRSASRTNHSCAVIYRWRDKEHGPAGSSMIWLKHFPSKAVVQAVKRRELQPRQRETLALGRISADPFGRPSRLLAIGRKKDMMIETSNTGERACWFVPAQKLIGADRGACIGQSRVLGSMVKHTRSTIK